MELEIRCIILKILGYHAILIKFIQLIKQERAVPNRYITVRFPSSTSASLPNTPSVDHASYLSPPPYPPTLPPKARLRSPAVQGEFVVHCYFIEAIILTFVAIY